MAVQFEPRQLTPFGSRKVNNTGTGGTSFLVVPDETDESDATYFYFGWESINGDWLVHRQTRATSQTVVANSTSNPSYVNLTAAWPDRTSLTYA